MERANGFDQFYSRMKNGGGVEYFVGKNGYPTISYPHVHVVHHGSGRVDIVASRSSSDHPWRTTINDPSGNKGSEIQSAVKTAIGKL